MAIFGIDLWLIVSKILKCVISISIGIIIYKFIKKTIIKLTTKSKTRSKYKQKRLQTIQSLLKNLTKYIIYIFVFLYILSIFGVNVSGIVAGLGVSAALIGLAFQDTAKDIIAGVSMITDDEFEIGDTVKIDGFMGEVVFIGLRSTKIRDYKGATMIIANHSINKVINYNLHDSLAVVDVSVAYESDLNEVEKVLNNLAKKLEKKLDYLKGDIEILGIDNLDDSAIVYRVTALVEPMKHIITQRTLRKEIAEAFKKSSVKIPYKQIEVHNAK